MIFLTGYSHHFRQSAKYFDAERGKCLTISDWMITFTYPMEKVDKINVNLHMVLEENPFFSGTTPLILTRRSYFPWFFFVPIFFRPSAKILQVRAVKKNKNNFFFKNRKLGAGNPTNKTSICCGLMDEANKFTVAFCCTNYFYIGEKEGWSYNWSLSKLLE